MFLLNMEQALWKMRIMNFTNTVLQFKVLKDKVLLLCVKMKKKSLLYYKKYKNKYQSPKKRTWKNYRYYSKIIKLQSHL